MASSFSFSGHYIIAAGETLTLDDPSGLRGAGVWNDPASLTNYGAISVAFWAGGAAVVGPMTVFRNYGTVSTETAWPSAFVTAIKGTIEAVYNYGDIFVRSAEAIAINSGGHAENDGEIHVFGEKRAGGVYGFGEFHNSGLLVVDASGGGSPTSASGAGGFWSVTNTGSIAVSAVGDGALALGAGFGWFPNVSMSNAGSIVATAVGAGAVSTGVNSERFLSGTFSFDNSGVVTADWAVSGGRAGYYSKDHVTNSGTLNGKIDLSNDDDSLVNSGIVTGAIKLGQGDDTYQGSAALGGVTVYGEDGNDTLIGGASDDTLSGGAGDDTLNGNGGVDVADYSSAASYVTVDLRYSTAQNTDGGGQDTLISIENVIGSNYDDRIWGDSAANRLQGMGGDDQLDGGLGNDILDGGSGFDTANYGSATSYVTIDLDYGSIQNTDAAGLDTFASIERVIGGNYDDRFWGSDANNFLHGGIGQDQLNGRGGEDLLDGGANHDILTGGSGPDVFVFRSTSDTHWDAPDRITDFAPGDRIDIGDIDADTTVGGNQAFHIATQPEAAGVYISYDAGSNRTTLRLDTDGDGNPEGRIWLDGDHRGLTAADFVL